MEMNFIFDSLLKFNFIKALCLIYIDGLFLYQNSTVLNFQKIFYFYLTIMSFSTAKNIFVNNFLNVRYLKYFIINFFKYFELCLIQIHFIIYYKIIIVYNL